MNTDQTKLLEILVCPVCHSKLTLAAGTLHCDKCQADYPVIDGIPVMIPPSRTQSQ